MESVKGTFIVIEGTNGSGKGTQFELLKNSLIAEGYAVAAFDFPQYSQPSSHFISKYLNGDYGTAEEVGPYTGSMFYALDRYEAAPAIRHALSEGKVVIANRFTGSNMAHQGIKFITEHERNGYFTWLDAIEFQMLNIPRPDMSIILKVPAEIACGLADQKTSHLYTDAREVDLSYLQKSVQVYDSLAKLFPKEFKQLDCTRDGKLLEISVIQKLIRETVDPLLPIKGDSVPIITKPSYKIPDISDKTREVYTQKIDQIISNYVVMFEQLAKYCATHELDVSSVSNVLNAALPVATNARPMLAPVLLGQLSNTFSLDQTPLTLVSASPRNEQDVLAEILYASSGLSQQEIDEEIEGWSYEQKAESIQEYLKTSHDRNALKTMTYEWDILLEYESLMDIKQNSSVLVTNQLLTPRYGYAVPQLVIDAGISDVFEQSFDISLSLYSDLQSARYDYEAQYAVLQGHKVRAKINCTAHDLLHTRETDNTLLKIIQSSAAETHPQLYAQLT